MFLGSLRRRAAGRVRAELGDGEIMAIDESANFFGLESRGKFQLRGNGCLAATRDEVLFMMWLPQREVRIPRPWITAVDRTRWHLGKSVARELLRIRFTNDRGQPDSVAFLVSDLLAWEGVLQG